MNDVDSTKIERSGTAGRGDIGKCKLPPPPKLCLGPCEPFSGLCPVCGGSFSTEDTLFKRIKQGEDSLILRLLTEDRHPVCEDCGDRFAPDLMRELENSSAKLFLWEYRLYDKNNPELGGIVVRVFDHVYCKDDVPF